MMREDAFLENYMPVNRHPAALLYAMLGTATIFSQHPLLYQNFQTPYKAAQYLRRSSRERGGKCHRYLVAMQTMILISIWDYGCFLECNHVDQWIGKSCRELHNLNLRKFNDMCTNNPFTIWHGPRDEQSLIEKEVRYRTFQSLVIIDTSASMASGLPLAIAEEDYACVLVDIEKKLKIRVKESEVRRLGSSEIDVGDSGAQEWRKMAHYPPLQIQGVPTHIITSEFDQYYLVQLCFIIRRILRLRRWQNIPTDYQDSYAALSVVPHPLNTSQLHDALVQFYTFLPEFERPFDSLADIPPPHMP
ncbi:hypothetical protein BC829DRAFT_469165 [Chytridium lagenaria]|nr:hypothetical protein BC829DRAFT_469165 [Chytridium lagenaria]